MAEYSFQYRVGQPQARNDGSGLVAHDVMVEASADGEIWSPVPARHATILVPASEIQDALSAGTNAQINQAYKLALANNLRTSAVPIQGWDAASLQALMEANDAASNATIAVIEYVVDTLGITFPVRFTF